MSNDQFSTSIFANVSLSYPNMLRPWSKGCSWQLVKDWRTGWRLSDTGHKEQSEQSLANGHDPTPCRGDRIPGKGVLPQAHKSSELPTSVPRPVVLRFQDAQNHQESVLIMLVLGFWPQTV